MQSSPSAAGASTPAATRDLVQQADKLRAEKKFKEAFDLYLQAAQRGNVSAEVAVGRAYEQGEGTDTDCAKAVEWYRQAVPSKNREAIDRLVSLYSTGGKNLPRDPSAASVYSELSRAIASAAQKTKQTAKNRELRADLQQAPQQVASLLQQGKIAEAARVWDDLSTRLPGRLDVEWPRFQFHSQHESGISPAEHLKAMDGLLTLLPKDDPRRLDVYLDRLEFLRVRGPRDDGKKEYQTYQKDLPESGAARERLGWYAFDFGDYQDAHRDLSAVLKAWEADRKQAAAKSPNGQPPLDPQRPLPRLPRQVELLGRLLSEPRDAAGLAERANLWAILGENQKAIADYSRTVEMAPRSVLARCWRAARYIAVGNDEAAAADIDAALRLNPKSSEAHACRGAALPGPIAARRRLKRIRQGHRTGSPADRGLHPPRRHLLLPRPGRQGRR